LPTTTENRLQLVPELVAEHDPRHHAHGERNGEDFGPEPGEAVEMLAAGRDPAHQQRGDERGQPDGEARKDDVERDGEGELQPCEQHRIEGGT
jgi:hypothetical protein